MTIGERVKERRTANLLPMDRLAKLVGYNSRTSIYRIEHGETIPPIPKIEKLALALNTTEAYLLGLTDDPERKIK